MATFVKPSVKTIGRYASEIYNDIEKSVSLCETQKIEIAGRTCYNSLNKINVLDFSDVKFSKNLIKRKHMPVLEFGHVCFEINDIMSELIYLSGYKFLNQTYSKLNGHIVSGSIRSWRDFVQHKNTSKTLKEYFLYHLKKDTEIGMLFDDLDYDYDVSFIKCNFEIKRITDFSVLTEDERKVHVYYHFVIETDRGVMSQLSRHRICSFGIESQRYVKYSNIEFVIPHWFDNKFDNLFKKIQHLYRQSTWKKACKASEKRYRNLIDSKMKPEDARSVLPNATKTIINICCNIEEYDHIFNMRCSKGAHPDIQIIANKMKSIINRKEYINGL